IGEPTPPRDLSQQAREFPNKRTDGFSWTSSSSPPFVSELRSSTYQTLIRLRGSVIRPQVEYKIIFNHSMIWTYRQFVAARFTTRGGAPRASPYRLPGRIKPPAIPAILNSVRKPPSPHPPAPGAEPHGTRRPCGP